MLISYIEFLLKAIFFAFRILLFLNIGFVLGVVRHIAQQGVILSVRGSFAFAFLPFSLWLFSC